MKKEKILINIENLTEIDEYKKIGINNFLFAVDYFSIGYNSFDICSLKELDCNKYILINRILNSSDVDKLKNIKSELLNFDGIIFEDIAVYNIFKDENIKLIWNQTHFATNYSSINYFLDLVYSVVISNELTNNEINEILNNSNKDLILNVFGKNPIMYSRRTLLSNFNNNFNLKDTRDIVLKEPITNNEFKVVESTFGTFIKNNIYFNLIPYLKELNNDKISFYLIYPDGLNYNQIIEYINGKVDGTNDGFRNKKTIYKLGDKK